ncbi:hypothetical protein IZ6_24690 [Terrihabitans soli]|uniref:Uncharacterized protein n=1 Tax=Terrihabitans soli TaxID=708113 RepID=A0A6S6QMN9_9HYPH|nr:hypothetical protein [Terrihabitans soli]BCJ91734.1 hypothetical protein IZ6_24690 [Terrihabitans soli]
MQLTFSERCYDWAIRALGHAVASNPRERVLRVLEEAIELAQTEGVNQDVIDATVNRVYSRPVGHAPQESAQVLLTLSSYAACKGYHLEAMAEAELAMVEDKLSSDPHYFAHRQAKKAGLGIGMKPQTEGYVQ